MKLKKKKNKPQNTVCLFFIDIERQDIVISRHSHRQDIEKIGRGIELKYRFLNI